MRLTLDYISKHEDELVLSMFVLVNIIEIHIMSLKNLEKSVEHQVFGL